MRDRKGLRSHRALLRHLKADPKPLLPGSNASCPTRTLSRYIDPVIDARSATLFLIALVDKPGVSCAWPAPAERRVLVDPAQKARVGPHLLEEESAHFIVPPTSCPNYKNVSGFIMEIANILLI
jgi:hypothetical protein